MINKILGLLLIITSGFGITTYTLMNYYHDELRDSRNEINALKMDIFKQNSSIHELVIAQEAKQKQVKMAMEDASLWKQKHDKVLKDVASETVPKNCERAIQWGSEQAHIASLCWTDKC